ncbi:HisA/HisF-related TIM barrel protein [Candidatus Carsonella ruddii]|uniref:Imidazole glycerol phosphate synthase subunit HisF n=1 Tax=Candidatus Carsonella ruddii (Diaphorina cf. continua) TaxID=2661587 RepID=A0A7R6VYF9_CARRU|nr:HisA/HisF-related TIM barrel protein [Candidatus Carsonella ruddii (Diaphorina cf. continua)]BCG49289.1 imidazole glycerol phosphate synthase subunit HisF [Candidatus Carsonella ruddii (Diaphorina cf. continua)]
MIRLISCFDIKNNMVVKGVGFNNLKIIENPVNLINKYINSKIDEIVLLDITSNYTKKSLSNLVIKKISKILDVPLSIGGGINTLEKISKLLKLGADRIIINSYCYENICFLKKITSYYGSQLLIVAIDIKKRKDSFLTYKNSGFKKTNFFLEDWCIIVKKMGCGEILLTSIEKDGNKNGYDINSLYHIKKMIDISIIISGGMGSINDIYYIFKYLKTNSFLIASLFHYNFLKTSYLKKYLKFI